MDELPPDEQDDKPVIRLIKGEKADPTSATSKKLKIRTRQYMERRPEMKAKRDRFISEYIKDWDGAAAVIRAGGAASTAVKMSNEYLREPYVAEIVYEIQKAIDDEKLIDNKTILMGLIKEARFHGIGASHGARVSAWKTLAQIKGLEKTVIKGDLTHTVRGGVMYLPLVADESEWEKLAQHSQKQLKAGEQTVEVTNDAIQTRQG